MNRFFLFLLLSYFNLSAQNNTIQQFSNNFFDQAIYFYHNNELSSAYDYFGKVLDEPVRFSSPQQDLWLIESKFHRAIIALKMGKKDAENQLVEMYNTSVDKSKREQIAFHLGCYSFDRGNFKKTLEWFELANIDLVTKTEKDKFQYRKAYSEMKLNMWDKAINSFDQIISNTESSYRELAYYFNGTMLFNQKKYDESERYLNKIQRTDNPKLDIAYILGQIHFLNKKYYEVIQLNENKLNANTPNYKERLLLVGKSYFHLNRYDKSEKYLADFLSLSEQISAEEMYQLAYSEYKNKNYKKAIQHFKDLQISSQDFSQYAMYALANSYLMEGEKNNARLAFISAAKYNTDAIIQEESRYNIAKLNFELNNFSEAIKGLDFYLQQYKNSKYENEAYKMMAQSLLAVNDYPKAIELIEKKPELIKGNEKIYQEVTYLYSLNLYKNGDYPLAIKMLQKSLKNPFDKMLKAEALFLQSEIYYKQKENNKAKESYTQLARFLEDENILYSDYGNWINTLYSLGYLEYQEKNLQSALNYFINAQKTIPASPTPHEKSTSDDIAVRIADIYFLLRNYDSAYISYQTFYERKTKGQDYALLQMATIEGIRKNNTKKVEILNNLISNYKKSIYQDDAQYQLGLAYEDLENKEKAISEYNNLIKSKPNSSYAPKSLLRIAIIELNKGNIDKANDYYTTILETYPNAPESEQALKAMRETFTAAGKLDEYFKWIQKLPNGKQIALTTQDSMLFDAGEEYYADGDCPKARNYFEKYLNMFPRGIFNKKANYYMGECYLEEKNYELASKYYTDITTTNDNPYYETASLRLAYIYFNHLKDTFKANLNYQKAYEIASSHKNRIISMLGLMITSYQLQKYEDALKMAREIKSSAEIPDIYKKEANFYSAMSQYWLGNKKEALDELHLVSKDKNSLKSAEAAYYFARIMHQNSEYKSSNEFLFKAKETFASYQYWVVKYFILIGENYHKLGDNFQANATLQSIINNYKGDKNLIDEAKERLKEVEESSKKESKVKYK